MKQNENGKKIKENIRNQMRRIGSWKSWSKRRKLTTGVCGVCVIAVVAGAIGLSGGSDTEVIYKETTVKYGTLVKGVTESGSVDIGTVDQTFDLDMSALQRTDTSGSSSSGGTNIAVYNTHRRLQILYGTDYGLTYSNNPGGGTEVEIHIPAIRNTTC